MNVIRIRVEEFVSKELTFWPNITLLEIAMLSVCRVIWLTAVFSGVATIADAQSGSAAYDGVYKGEVTASRSGRFECAGGARTWTIRNGEFSFPTNYNGLKKDYIVKVTEKGEFFAETDLGDVKGSVKAGQISAKWVTKNCSYVFELSKSG